MSTEGLAGRATTQQGPRANDIQRYVSKEGLGGFGPGSVLLDEGLLTVTDPNTSSGIKAVNTVSINETGHVVKVVSAVSGLDTTWPDLATPSFPSLGRLAWFCTISAVALVGLGAVVAIAVGVILSGNLVTAAAFWVATFAGVTLSIRSGYRIDRVNSPNLELMPDSLQTYVNGQLRFAVLISTVVAMLSALLWSAIATKGDGRHDEVDGEQLLASGFSLGQASSLSVQSALLEEGAFRLVGTSVLLYLTDQPIVAVVVPALLWGCMHDWSEAQPAWLRGSELLFQGVAFGTATLLYGPITAVVAHLCYNLMVMAGPVILGQSRQKESAQTNDTD